jgi:4-amino-4-deoxy-L-arabinose transferase-like glycosyltransferase
LQSQAGTLSNKKFLTLKVDEKYWWYFPFIVFFALLFYKLGSIAGLHRDEAIFGLEAIDILKGDRPISGAFNEYTSPLYYYIVALIFSILGKSIWTLRISSVIFNLLAALAMVDVVRRYSSRTAIYSIWFLATLPAVVVLSRIAGENYALNPFFLFGGVWCFAVLGSSQSPLRSRIGYALSGLSFGLGVWNHIISAPIVLTVAIVYVIGFRPTITQLKKISLPFLSGVLIAALPRLFIILWFDRPWIPESPPGGVASPESALLNLLYTLGGNGLYARSSGEVLISLNWFLPLCLLLSTAVLFIPRVSSKTKKIYLLATSTVLLGSIVTWLISPGFSLGSRFWLLPLWFVPLMMGAAVTAIKRSELRMLVGGAIVVINLVLIGTNYFYAFSKTGGIPRSEIYVGGRFDNSFDFIDMRPMLNKVLHYDNHPFYLPEGAQWSAMFLTPESQRKRIRVIQKAFSPKEQVAGGSLFAFYRIPGKQLPSAMRLRNLILEARPQLSTSNFIVYESVVH